jgi:hypothetical protein
MKSPMLSIASPILAISSPPLYLIRGTQSTSYRLVIH